jgi:hypothetical protein
MSNASFGGSYCGPSPQRIHLHKAYVSQKESLERIKETEAELKEAEDEVKRLQCKLDRAKETELQTRRKCIYILQKTPRDDQIHFINAKASDKAVLELAKSIIEGENRGETGKDESTEE